MLDDGGGEAEETDGAGGGSSVDLGTQLVVVQKLTWSMKDSGKQCHAALGSCTENPHNEPGQHGRPSESDPAQSSTTTPGDNG